MTKRSNPVVKGGNHTIMARLNSFLKIQGSLEGFTFYRRNGKIFIRRKGGVSRERLLSEPKFRRARENMREFGRASHFSKSLRWALNPLIAGIKDGSMYHRLSSVIRKGMHADTNNEKGQRTLDRDNIACLEGFEFNKNSSTQSTLIYRPFCEFNTSTGMYSIRIKSVEGTLFKKFPSGCTHAKISAGLLEWDMRKDGSRLELINPVTIDVRDYSLTECKLSAEYPSSNAPVCVVLVIRFYQQINGGNYELLDRKFCAGSILRIFC